MEQLFNSLDFFDFFDFSTLEQLSTFSTFREKKQGREKAQQKKSNPALEIVPGCFCFLGMAMEHQNNINLKGKILPFLAVFVLKP